MVRLALCAALGLALLAAVPAGAAPPPDAFCVILLEALPGMQGVRVLVDEETTPTEREALFPEVDGDGDGTITRAEGDAWRRANLALHNGTEGLDPVVVVRLRPTDTDGGGEPLYAATTRQVGHTFHKQDHQQPWPVTASIDLETQAVREFSFPLVEGAQRFELLGGGAATSSTGTATSTTTATAYAGSATPEYVVVRAPEGWLVERVTGSSYDGRLDQTYSAREVDLPAFDTRSPFVVTFVRDTAAATATGTATDSTTATRSGTAVAQDDKLDIPAAALPLAVLVLGALARRRRL